MLAALLYLAVFPGLLAGPAQQGPSSKRPTAEAHIARIQYGSGAGMCMGYCYTATIIQSGMVRSVSRTNASLEGHQDKEHPDMKSQWKITAQDWERAKAAVDTGSLFSLPDKIGCPGCVDEPVDWITVDYSDGTKKTVTCNAGGPPTEIANKVKAALPRIPSKGLGPFQVNE
jgi:hypothetical protein